MTDIEFMAHLTARTVPLFKKDDGSIDRNKTLALPCYADFHLEQ